MTEINKLYFIRCLVDSTLPEHEVLRYKKAYHELRVPFVSTVKSKNIRLKRMNMDVVLN